MSTATITLAKLWRVAKTLYCSLGSPLFCLQPQGTLHQNLEENRLRKPPLALFKAGAMSKLFIHSETCHGHEE
ncbi:hypothetical protein OAH23_09220 [Verrucomicrobia bacterium]|nr:hypothetical protein [Verrucomicrobiota bacterium]